ncbi:MAG TPA: MFS transporter [Gemmatimonadaceae bacterium]|nr:MFS transporter [Gemmatimonadaceae bacterium]
MANDSSTGPSAGDATSARVTPPARAHEGRLPRTVLALSLVSLLTDVSSEMIYPLIPTFLATTLGASALAVGAIEGTAEAVASVLKYASGWWSDRLRRRKPLVVAGYLLASVLRPLVGVAQGVSQVFAIRVGDRIGKGIRTAPRDALLADAVAPSQRGAAFGFHRAADHLGAVIGPLVAFVLMRWLGIPLRGVFLLAAIPAALAMVVLIAMVREGDGARQAQEVRSGDVVVGGGAPGPPLGARFGAFLAVLVVFTLGNSTDAFLLLRARSLGVETAMLPVLWAALHVVKALASAPAGALSDRVGRRRLIIGGWLVYALTYVGFAFAEGTWSAWLLFLVYGAYFGMTEGVEKALVADLVPAAERGRAFGLYHLAIALGALPASLLFGAVWDARGASAAFLMGASLAALAALLLPLAVPRRIAPA